MPVIWNMGKMNGDDVRHMPIGNDFDSWYQCSYQYLDSKPHEGITYANLHCIQNILGKVHGTSITDLLQALQICFNNVYQEPVDIHADMHPAAKIWLLKLTNYILKCLSQHVGS